MFKRHPTFGILAIILGIGLCLFPPWKVEEVTGAPVALRGNFGFHFLFRPPALLPGIDYRPVLPGLQFSRQVDFDKLVLLELAPLGVLYLFVCMVTSVVEDTIAYRRRERGECPKCGYNLSVHQGKCPECGAAVESNSSLPRLLISVRDRKN